MRWSRAASLLLVMLSGCGHHKPYHDPPRPVTFSLVVPRYCIVSVELTPDTYCKGKDLQHLTCYAMKLNKTKGCEEINVVHD